MLRRKNLWKTLLLSQSQSQSPNQIQKKKQKHHLRRRSSNSVGDSKRKGDRIGTISFSL